MADPKIKIEITADDKASPKLKDLDGNVSKTGTGMGNLGKAAAAGAAAVVALGVKSVMAFEDTGLAVGKMADATGLTSEQASRLKEVAEDLGISQDVVTGAIGKMSKALGANADAFAEYGIQVKKGADGQTDVNATFLDAVDKINAIQDPLKKAEASAKVFGKGYQGMAELLGKSSKDIQASLAAVSDQKVFDDKKVNQARDLREAFDTIVDSAQDLMLVIGQALAPVIARLAPTLEKVIKAAGPLAESIGEVLASALESLGPIIEGLLPVIQGLAKALSLVADVISAFKPTGFTKAMAETGTAIEDVEKRALAAGLSVDEFREMVAEASKQVVPTGDHMKDLASAVALVDQRLKPATTSTEHMGMAAQDLAHSGDQATDSFERMGLGAYENSTAMAKVAQATTDAKNAYDALILRLDQNAAWRNMREQLEQTLVKLGDMNASVDEQAASIDDSRRATAQWVYTLQGIDDEYKARIFAEIGDADLAKLDRISRLLAAIDKNKNVSITATVNPGGLPGHAAGTESTAPGWKQVGEHGPEWMWTPGGDKVLPHGNTPRGGGGNVYNITVKTGADPQQVIQIVRQYTKNGGRLP